MNLKVISGVSLVSSIERCGGFDGAAVYKITADWENSDVKEGGSLKILVEYPICGITNVWLPNSAPMLGVPRFVKPDWNGRHPFCNIARSAPLLSFYDNADENRFTLALSETQKNVVINYGVNEKSTLLCISFEIELSQYAQSKTAQIYLYANTQSIPMESAVRQAVIWWEREGGCEPMRAPDCAFEPLYSFWYSYHQDVYEADVERECRLAKEYGFKNVIVDDGWQTDETNGGYAYCGDWKPFLPKIKDMASHVKRVHDMGLKYILWFSVPFIGIKSENRENFKDKILYFDESKQTGILDPRYREVRQFLIAVYKDALMQWDLDGFKLDYIDWFENKENVLPNKNMDIPVLADAVDALMVEIRRELAGVKSDVLIEFRQTYIGPNIRKYGNMLRAADCPYDYLSNRVATLDLRLTSGRTAVHSDMLIWNGSESVQNAALQIANCIFSVVQISVKLGSLPKIHQKMLRFWIKFMDENKELLLKSSLTASEPHLYYTSATAFNDGREITAVYSNDKCVTVSRKSAVIINATARNYVLCHIVDGRKRKVKILDCTGRAVCEYKICAADGVLKIDAPQCAMIILENG